MSVDWDSLVIGPVVDTFGDPVTYSRNGAVVGTIYGVFDQEYMEINPIGGRIDEIGLPGNVSSSRPVFGVQISKMPIAPAQGDQITLQSGASFVVREVRPDNHGWAKLLLNEAS